MFPSFLYVTSLRLIRQNVDGFVELRKDFRKTWVGLLHNKGSEILCIALLYLGGLHDIGITTRVVVEPADEQTAAGCLTAVTRLADV